jgi:alpha-L-rhamnosidase
VRIAPVPVLGLRHASARVDSAYGRVTTGWRLDDGGTLHVDLELPAGTSAELRLPTSPMSVVTVDGSAASAEVTLGPGRHRATVSDARVVDPSRVS